MSRSTHNLYIRPLFYDLLSGEFNPPSDKQGRAHTLGRLAYAAFSKGQSEVVDEDMLAPYLRVDYRPTWASSVLVTLTCDFGANEALSYEVDSLGLQVGKRSNSLFIADENRNGKQNVHIGTWQDDVRLPVALGDELNTARAQVTDAAQAFFNIAGQLEVAKFPN